MDLIKSYNSTSPNIVETLNQYMTNCNLINIRTDSLNWIKKRQFDTTDCSQHLTKEFKNIKKIKERSVNRGPWNIERYKIKIVKEELLLQ